MKECQTKKYQNLSQYMCFAIGNFDTIKLILPGRYKLKNLECF